MPTLRRNAGLLALALALCACTRAGPGGKTPDGRNPWTHPDQLVIAAAYAPRNLNPAFATAAPVLELSMFLFSWAVRYDDKSRPVPDALREIPTVENGDVSNDGLTLRYKLRPRMFWHDGAPVRARISRLRGGW